MYARMWIRTGGGPEGTLRVEKADPEKPQKAIGGPKMIETGRRKIVGR